MAKTEQRTWEQHVQQWKASGLTARSYAIQEGLAIATLYGWSTRYRRTREKSSPRFVEVVAGPEPIQGPDQRLEIHIGADIIIPVRPGFDPAFLRNVVVALVAR